ncbi:hypothetical protein PACTADRAFT_50962 [Pachysolen tannophilus NRRL Y-2460]|uniref:DNA topoisomerase 2 n=1 Tax=Pachysolen tannophilus NRRL Y-2460 TaxID=669874 RepID=A0A1E4TQQ1_PACTA|nr:hypothetical protein PACTADRAFT_50962 [Pachysolen tannophilus NRRL Y-2460]
MSDLSDDEFIMSEADDDFVSGGKKAPKVNATKKKPLKDTTNTTSVSASASSKTSGSISNSAVSKKNKTASEQYQKLSQLEHILKRPDTYVGSVEKFSSELWIYDEDTESMALKTVSIVPGLFKIFDEILVNAADNKIRDASMKRIDVTIDPEKNLIEVKNDGKGIPIVIHEKEKIYIPELIFGNLLTSSNYDDDEKKVTGGRNGYGAKLANIFSTEFTVETADKTKLYKQTWKGNMQTVGKPKITDLKKPTEYTKISFCPDLSKFHMEKLDEDILGVMRRRVYDICGSVSGVDVSLNGKKLKIKGFKQYVGMYVKALEEARNPTPAVKTEDDTPQPTSTPPPTIVHQVINDRWEIAFAVTSDSFKQVSFVNSIATTSGGTHVNYLSDMLVKEITEAVKKRNKKAIIKPFQIRNSMFIFINCLIENPSFTSQTKEQLTTRPSQFGGKKITIPDEFLKKVMKTEIIANALEAAASNAEKALARSDGTKKNRITKYVKLEDANKAGTREGYKSTLILTEGDSAKTLAVAGLAVVGRDYYGCYPLRGKMLNIREAGIDQIMKNAEIQAIKEIMGLKQSVVYDSQKVKDLRYGHIMIMTDQDTDGSHIKGLIINFLTSFKGLLNVPGFLLDFMTPIVKVTISGKNKRVLSFYNMPEYEKWRETEGKTCSWKQKYYKGLGTSSQQEAREYFSNLDRHLKEFHSLQGNDDANIDLAFSKKRADDRKEWLRGFQPGTHLDPTLKEVYISEFINKELILFSMADNIRSIPSVLDGFKPGQRKVLFACFKRNLINDIKVSELAGFVSEKTGYHHGEQSLVQTIIGLAQDFVGSNNIYLLMPNGSFGTRATGGKDASAARYIFTELSKITPFIFNSDDNALYSYVQDDEQTVEPEWYLPVIPMILVNGADGIGTGWSTNIPNYNPLDLTKNIKHLMNDEEIEDMIPWYRGWEGNIEPNGPDKYKMTGVITQIDDNTLVITELPVKMWINSMKEFLLLGLSGNEKTKPWIEDMTEEHGVGIKFVVTLSDLEMKKTHEIGVYERFKLNQSVSLSNMVAFDPNGRIKKYESAEEILRDYYFIRLEFYQKRKDHLSEDLSNQLERLSAQARFIKLIIDGSLVISNRKKVDIIDDLIELEFPKLGSNGKMIKVENSDTAVTQDDIAVAEEEEEEVEELEGVEGAVINKRSILSSYDYLLNLPIYNLTFEKYQKLLEEQKKKEDVLITLLKKSAKDLWSEDLEKFEEQYAKFLEQDEEKKNSLIPDKVSGKKKGKRKFKTDTSATSATSKKVKPNTNSKVKKESSVEPNKLPKQKQSTLPISSAVKKEEVKSEKPRFPSVFGRSNTIFGSPKTSKAPNSSTKKNDDILKPEEITSYFNIDSDDDDLKDIRSSSNSGSTSKNPTSSAFVISDDDDDENNRSLLKAASTLSKSKFSFDSSDEEVESTPVPKTSIPKNNKIKNDPVNQKKPTVKKPNAKSLKSSTQKESESDLEMLDSSEATPEPVSRPRRAVKAGSKKVNTYKFSDDEDEDENDEDEEEDDDVEEIDDDSDDYYE